MLPSDLKSRLEIASHIGAFAIAVCYVAGFMVVTFSNASYGIVGFGLLRAKVLSAGILFSIFLVFPMLQSARAFSLFGFLSPLPLEPAKEMPKAESDFYSRGVRLLDYFISSWATVFIICPFVFVKVDFRRSYLLINFSFLIVAFIVTHKSHVHFSKSPGYCFIASVGMILLGVGSLALIKKWDSVLLLIWFLVIGSYIHDLDASVKEPRILRDEVNWFWTLLIIIGVISFFTIAFYPKILPQFGGGKPIEATFQFANSSPIDGTTKTKGWIVDEVDGGYYILLTPEDRKSIFIPKPLVSAVYFESK
jgi:hypothetical protein